MRTVLFILLTGLLMALLVGCGKTVDQGITGSMIDEADQLGKAQVPPVVAIDLQALGLCASTPSVFHVPIDLIPDDLTNTVAMRSGRTGGSVSMAFLSFVLPGTTILFDARFVDLNSIMIYDRRNWGTDNGGGWWGITLTTRKNGTVPFTLSDVNGDGLFDVVVSVDKTIFSGWVDLNNPQPPQLNIKGAFISSLVNCQNTLIDELVDYTVVRK